MQTAKKAQEAIPLHYLFIAIAFIALFLNIGFYTHFQYFLHGDRGLSAIDFKLAYQSLFTWQPNNYSGYASIPASIVDELSNLIAVITDLFGSNFGYILYTSLFSLIGLTGMFYLIYDLTEIYTKRVRYIGSIAASIIFSFQLPALPFIAVSAAFLPWIFLFWKRLFYGNETGPTNQKAAFSGLVLSILLLLGTTSGYILQNLMVLSLLAAVTVTFCGKGRFVRNLKLISAIVLLSVLGSIDLLTSLYVFAVHSSETYFTGSIATLYSSASNIIQSFNLLSGGEVTLTSLGILGIGLLSYFFVKNGKAISRMMVLSLLIVFLFVIALATTINPPFGPVFLKALGIFPYLLALRYPSGALMYLFAFLASALFGVGASYLMNGFFSKGKKYAPYQALVFALLIVILASYLYTNDYVPITAHANYENASFVNIPNYAFQVADYINAQNSSSPIATLPLAYGWQFTNWYFGVNAYSGLLINHPVYTGGFTNYAEIFFPGSVNEYNYYMENITDKEVNQSEIKLSNVFGIFGISYIIVQGDALHKVPFPCDGCSIQPFNLTDIYYNLNESSNIHFLKSYSNTSIYENTNYAPLVFAANLRNMNGASNSEVLDAIENESFDIHNTVVYAGNGSNGIPNATTLAAINPVSNFSQPSVTFTETAPTRIVVQVNNSTTPYYLVFRETYDPSWHAYYSNGTAAPSSDHIMVNGFANAWYLDKKGNYSVTLHYTEQSIVWPLYAVSATAIAITLYIGILGLRNAKQGSKRRIK